MISHSFEDWVFEGSLKTKWREGISHFIGKTNSSPKIRWKGVNPVAVLTKVLYAHKDGKSIKCYLVLCLFIVY